MQAANNISVGELSPATSFSTPESGMFRIYHPTYDKVFDYLAVPAMPESLLVEYNGSMSLVVTWNPPLCDYGIRTSYNVSWRISNIVSTCTRVVGDSIITTTNSFPMLNLEMRATLI